MKLEQQLELEYQQQKTLATAATEGRAEAEAKVAEQAARVAEETARAEAEARVAAADEAN